MLIRIKETGEIKSLEAIHCERQDGGTYNRYEWTRDLIEDGGREHDEDGNTVMTAEDYDWWQKYIADMDADEGELNDLTAELRRLGVDNAADEVRDIVADYLAYMDMEDHHKGRQRAIAEIRERHGLSVSELEAAQ